MPTVGKKQQPGSPYKRLVQDWCNCTRCPLSEVRRNVVIAKGSIPARVLLIGEAPGESEDTIGKPFVGPAGKLLDAAIIAALEDSMEKDFGPGPAPSMCFTNLVSCIPKNPDTKRKNIEPLPAEIEACRPRLDTIIDLCKPEVIVCVGALAEKQAKLHKWAERTRHLVSVIHPAAIIRLDISQKGLAYQRLVVQLSDVFSELAPF